MSSHHHTSHSNCWDHTADERIGLIADRLKRNDDIRKKLPGLRDILKDYVDPDVPVAPADFHRRLLRVFRDSDADFAYQECLKKLTEDERDRIEKFVADDQPLDDVSRDFDMCVSIGVREHLQHLTGVDCAWISSEGVRTLAAAASKMAQGAGADTVQVKGLSGSGRGPFSWLEDKDNIFLAFLNKLKDLFLGHGEDHNVIVST
jgi:hypothetical protein